MSSVKTSPVPISDSTETFKSDILKGKVVFCTGGSYPTLSFTTRLPPYVIGLDTYEVGRSGICYTITEVLMRHGADSVIIGRE